MCNGLVTVNREGVFEISRGGAEDTPKADSPGSGPVGDGLLLRFHGHSPLRASAPPREPIAGLSFRNEPTLLFRGLRAVSTVLCTSFYCSHGPGNRGTTS